MARPESESSTAGRLTQQESKMTHVFYVLYILSGPTYDLRFATDHYDTKAACEAAAKDFNDMVGMPNWYMPTTSPKAPSPVAFCKKVKG